MGKKRNVSAYDAEVYETLSDPEVFSDLFNGAVFGGRLVVRPEDLKPLEEKEVLHSRVDSRYPEILYMIRDVSKENISVPTLLRVILNVEGQREVHYGMPLRVMQYDAARYGKEYRRLQQIHKKAGDLKRPAEFLSGIRKEDRLPPVLTLVFYYGEEQDWEGPLSLHEMLAFPEEFQRQRRWFPDYRMNLVSSRTVNKNDFRTGLREVFELLAVMGDKTAMLALLGREEERYRKLDRERAGLIGTFLNIPLLSERGEEEIDMCTAIQEMILEGKAEGRAEGRAEGMTELVLDFLSGKGELQESLREQICRERDPEVLREWVHLAVQAGSVQEFEQKIQK